MPHSWKCQGQSGTSDTKLQSKDIGKNVGKRDILEKPYKFYTSCHHILGPASAAPYSDYQPSHTDTCGHT